MLMYRNRGKGITLPRWGYTKCHLTANSHLLHSWDWNSVTYKPCNPHHTRCSPPIQSHPHMSFAVAANTFITWIERIERPWAKGPGAASTKPFKTFLSRSCPVLYSLNAWRAYELTTGCKPRLHPQSHYAIPKMASQLPKAIECLTCLPQRK